MRHTLYLIILCLGLVEAQAQKLSKSYKEGGFYRHHQFPQPDYWQCCAPGGRFLSDADY